MQETVETHSCLEGGESHRLGLIEETKCWEEVWIHEGEEFPVCNTIFTA